MRNKLAAGLCGLILVLVAWSSASASAAGGVTISPAALTINLAENQSQATTEFSVTNHYAVAVTLAFQFEAPDKVNPLLFSQNPVLQLEPGETRQQVIGVQDSTQLAPGSQNLTLVVSQQQSEGRGVGVASHVRLPLTIIKQAGAVTNFSVLGVSAPRLSPSIPETVNVQLENTGNMTVIPRGYVTVASPRGDVVAQGTLNSSSLALSPGNNFTLQTPLTRLTSALLPGPYRINVHYGLGGGQGSQQKLTTMWYVAWWQLVASVALGMGAYYIVRYVLLTAYRRKIVRRRPRPKRLLLIGRDLS